MATDYSEEKATEILSENYVTAICDMKMGEAEATAWGDVYKRQIYYTVKTKHNTNVVVRKNTKGES